MKNKLYSIFDYKSKKIMFVHVPKCGGSSVSSAITKTYGLWNRLRRKGFAGINPGISKRAAELANESLHEFRRKILIFYLSNQSNRCVKGHVSINKNIINKFNREWNFVTILRNPVERWYSEYFYNRFKEVDHFKTDLGLEAYVTSKRGVQTGHKYVLYFSGREKYNVNNIEIAKKNLKKFSIVGLLENIELFERDFKRVLDVKISVPHVNKNPAPRHVRENIPISLHEKVVEICKPDIEIYNWVKNNLAV